MGYYLVMAMLAVAMIAVLLAFAWDVDAEERGRAKRGVLWLHLGASDAAGLGLAEPARENWVSLIADGLPDDVTVENLAISGSLLGDATRVGLPRAVEGRADVVSIWLAVNDLLTGVELRRYETDLVRLLRELREVGARVVVGNLPDLTRVPAVMELAPDAEMVREIVGRWNAAIARVASAYGAALVDLHGASAELTAAPGALADDGFHPSVNGQRLLAEVFRPAVMRAVEEARAERGAGEAGGDVALD